MNNKWKLLTTSLFVAGALTACNTERDAAMDAQNTRQLSTSEQRYQMDRMTHNSRNVRNVLDHRNVDLGMNPGFAGNREQRYYGNSDGTAYGRGMRQQVINRTTGVGDNRIDNHLRTGTNRNRENTGMTGTGTYPGARMTNVGTNRAGAGATGTGVGMTGTGAGIGRAGSDMTYMGNTTTGTKNQDNGMNANGTGTTNTTGMTGAGTSADLARMSTNRSAATPGHQTVGMTGTRASTNGGPGTFSNVGTTGAGSFNSVTYTGTGIGTSVPGSFVGVTDTDTDTDFNSSMSDRHMSMGVGVPGQGMTGQRYSRTRVSTGPTSPGTNNTGIGIGNDDNGDMNGKGTYNRTGLTGMGAGTYSGSDAGVTNVGMTGTRDYNMNRVTNNYSNPDMAGYNRSYDANRVTNRETKTDDFGNVKYSKINQRIKDERNDAMHDPNPSYNNYSSRNYHGQLRTNNTGINKTINDYNVDGSGAISEQIQTRVKNVRDVDRVAAVTYGDDILIAVKPRNAAATGTLEDDVRQAAEPYAQGREVHVTVTKTMYDRVRNMNTRLRSGSLTNDMNNDIRDLFRSIRADYNRVTE